MVAERAEELCLGAASKKVWQEEGDRLVIDLGIKCNSESESTSRPGAGINYTNVATRTHFLCRELPEGARIFDSGAE
jgi:hypothetical protein